MNKKQSERKMFLENLPKKQGNFNKIDWLNCKYCKVKFNYDNIIDEIEIVDVMRENKRTILLIQYKNIQEKINTDNFQKCKIGNILLKNTSNFKIEINEKLKSKKRDLIIINREHRPVYKSSGKLKQNQKWYKYHCNICGYEGWTIESSLLTMNVGCSSCCNYNSKPILGINTIYDTDSWMIPYIGEEIAKTHTFGSNDKVQVTCPDCGRNKHKPMQISTIYKHHSIGCSCADGISYGEKFINNILEQLKIDFRTQLNKKDFNWCKRYKYDFYFEINNEVYICEVNGKQHYNNCSWEKLEKTQLNDRLKKELALSNGIEEENYIIIDCRESNLDWIRDNENGILNSKLAKLFDLSLIDWIKAEEFALKNRAKEACDIKRNNPNITTTEIGLILNLSSDSIRNYLKKGTKYGWCDYNSQKESLRIIKNNSILNPSKFGKPVAIFKNDEYLDTFLSCTDLEKQSEKLFGMKLLQSCMTLVCNGKQKQHKGYYFKYVSNLTSEEYVKFDIENKLKELNNKVIKNINVI